MQGADALVVATESPLYRAVSARQLLHEKESLVVLDANRLVPQLAASIPGVRYFSVGMPEEAP
jgi:hypothetical protein